MLLKPFCFLALALFTFSCGQSADSTSEPVEVHLGEDVCSGCGMIISDEHFGAQMPGQKSAALFDDVGCLLKHSKEYRGKPIFVRSYEDGRWIPFGQSFAVLSNQIHSPMGHGIATFATEQAANAHAARYPGATVRGVASLLEHPTIHEEIP